MKLKTTKDNLYFNKDKIYKFLLYAALVIFLLPNNVLAQSTDQVEEISSTYLNWMVFITILLTTLSFILLFKFGMEPDKPVEEEDRISVWEKVKEHLVGAAPIEKEQEILMPDDFDGIRELDNKVPPWFNYLFYVTIIFGVIYMLNYYVFKTGKLQYQEYADEVKAAALVKEELVKSGTLANFENVTLLKDAKSLQDGKKIFMANCIPCHGTDAGGVIGPNLTDKYWIHGGGIKNVFKTISQGVLLKGMPDWETKFNSHQIQEVASYVLSLQGTHPKNPKPPQGDLYNGDDNNKSNGKSIKEEK